ncbi:MAG TPA: DUF2946 family protein [Candidatus Binataceae bacterium]|nr:DUF2946 family protein [Candidatus Binataceae bacterium]
MRRVFSAAAAILLLFAQFAGAAHYHESDSWPGRGASAQLSATEGFCPICHLAHHSPGSVAAIAATFSDPVAAERIEVSSLPVFHASAYSTVRGRAPPASLQA